MVQDYAERMIALHIYVAVPGDSVWSVARKFSLSPEAVVYANQLASPAVLAVGQALLLPVYALSYTVSPGQTVSSVARSLQVSEARLLAQNPQLTDPDRLSAGAVLNVTFAEPKRGPLRTNGYAYPNISDASLEAAAPRMTYLSPFSCSLTAAGDLVPLAGDRRLIAAAYRAAAAPLLTLTNLNEGAGGFSSDILHTLLVNQRVQDNFLAQLFRELDDKSYYGVNVDFEYVYPYDKASYEQFLRRLADALRRRGYTVCAALAPKVSADQQGILYSSHDYRVIGAIMDFVILMTYEWGYTYGPPEAVSPLNSMRRVLAYAVTEIPREKLWMSLPNYGYDWTLPYVRGTAARALTNTAAVTLAGRTGAAIAYDERKATPYFRYLDDAGRRHEVWFDDARSIKAKLSLAAEYGLAGVSWWTLNPLYRTNFLLLEAMYDVQKVL